MQVSLLTLALAGVLSVSQVSAETIPTTRAEQRETFLKEKGERMEVRATGMKEKAETIEANVTGRAEKRQEHRSEVAKIHADNLEKQFNAHYTRLSELATKLQTKITTLKTAGKDTTAAQAKLDAAKVSLESAKTLGQEAIAGFKAIDPAKYEEQKTQALAARDKAKSAREAFVKALQDMKDALKAIQALKPTE